MHRKQLAAMVAWAIAGARVQPIVLIFEDLQWFDPSSIEFFRALSDRCVEAPLLILATARPEFQPARSPRSHHSVISLTPLDTAQVRRMVVEIACRRALPTQVVQGVSERAGGVPLFVEEVTRLLLERGEDGGAQAIPPTLRQSLAARLDRLGTAREVAQIGAVLGRSFSYALLRDVASRRTVGGQRRHVISEDEFGGLDEISLQSGLGRLLEADLLFVEGAPPQASYRFKHALVQDAAYDSLLKSRRQALHRCAAQALIEASGEPEAVAHHFSAAGLDEPAIEWWGKSGEEALRRAAFKEAIAHLGKAIAIADKAGHGISRREDGDTTVSSRRLKLQTAYGQAVMWSKGFASDEASIAYARVGELAGQAGDSTEQNVVYYAQWIRAFIRGEINLARGHVELLLREAEVSGRATDAVVAYRTLGLTCLFQASLLSLGAASKRRWRITRPKGTWMPAVCSAPTPGSLQKPFGRCWRG
jgi:hypothetical protein